LLAAIGQTSLSILWDRGSSRHILRFGFQIRSTPPTLSSGRWIVFGSQGWPRGDGPTLCQCRCRDSSSNRSLTGSHVRSQVRWARIALACKCMSKMSSMPCEHKPECRQSGEAIVLHQSRSSVRFNQKECALQPLRDCYIMSQERMYAAICVVDSGPCICNSTLWVCVSVKVSYMVLRHAATAYRSTHLGSPGRSKHDQCRLPQIFAGTCPCVR
jgi:hypothetical protein